MIFYDRALQKVVVMVETMIFYIFITQQCLGGYNRCVWIRAKSREPKTVWLCSIAGGLPGTTTLTRIRQRKG